MLPVIRFDRVSKRFGQQVALDRVSFEVPPGVVFALLGENGAGKTTALRIMLGLAEADSGDVQVFGLDSQKRGLEIRRRVGYVAEQPALYDWMTVREIGWFTAGFYNDDFLTHYLDLVKQFELPLKRRLKALSKGMRAKVVLSLALAHQPRLLVLDEPTSRLDALVRREFLESMVDLAATGRTVLLSSHQINEVERVADYVAIVREGRLLAVEPLEQLKSQFQQLTVTTVDGIQPPVHGLDAFSAECDGRQWQLLVRNMSEELLVRLRDDPAVLAVEIHRPNLEEIFVAYMKAPRPDDRAPGQSHVPEEVVLP